MQILNFENIVENRRGNCLVELLIQISHQFCFFPRCNLGDHKYVKLKQVIKGMSLGLCLL